MHLMDLINPENHVSCQWMAQHERLPVASSLLVYRRAAYADLTKPEPQYWYAGTEAITVPSTA